MCFADRNLMINHAPFGKMEAIGINSLWLLCLVYGNIWEVVGETVTLTWNRRSILCATSFKGSKIEGHFLSAVSDYSLFNKVLPYCRVTGNKVWVNRRSSGWPWRLSPCVIFCCVLSPLPLKNTSTDDDDSFDSDDTSDEEDDTWWQWHYWWIVKIPPTSYSKP